MDKNRFNDEQEEFKDETLKKEGSHLPELADDDFLEEEFPEEILPEDEQDYPDEIIEPVQKKWDKKKKKRGSKKYRSLIYAVSALLLLVIAYGAIKLFIPDLIPEIIESNGSQYDYLVNFKTSDISSLKFEFADGYSYEVKLNRAIGESGYVETAYNVVGKAAFVYDATAFSSMMSAISSITSTNVAVEAPSDLSVYGLKNPFVKVTYTDLEGKQTVLLIGDPVPVGTGRYIMVEGSDKVYVIGAYSSGYLTNKDMYYRDKKITAFTDDVLNEIYSVSISQGEKELYVRLQSKEERTAQGLFATDFQIKAPVDVGCNSVYLEHYLFSYFKELNAIEVIEDYPADLSLYGLAESDNPIAIEVVSADETVKKIYLGNKAGDGIIYGRISGVTSVYTFNAASFEFTDVTYGDIMEIALWTYMITDVKSVDMVLDGERHTLEFNHINDETLEGKLDGTETIEMNARLLYNRILQIYSYDVLKDSAEYNDIVYSFKINFIDGTEYTLEFARVTDRAFAVIRNGEPLGLYTRITSIDPVIKGIAAIKAGEKLGRTV